MDRQAAFSAYVRAASLERQEYLRQQAVKKARAFTRDMKPAEREAYLQSQAFANTLYHMQRRDKAYQAMQRGELVLNYHQAEFERLAPLIGREMQEGREIDLAFLRSVERCRAPLAKARAALELLERQAPRKFLEKQTVRFTGEAAERTERYLSKGDLSRLVRKGQGMEAVVSHVMETAFRRGIPNDVLESAFAKNALADMLQGEVNRAFPELAACGSVSTASGETVSAAVRAEIQREKATVFAGVRKRFPPEKIRRLLAGNPSLKRLQKQADAALAREKNLRSALLNAIPAHYRDLYPLARRMRRRFILHLGPTNSGKTYEGVGRLRGARRGIYLGPLRLLAAEQFESLNRDDVPCSLVTGEEQIRVPGSRVQSSTVEMADLKTHYDVAVIDECQMIADRDRGGAWTAAILGLCADEIHACASPDAEALLTRIIQDCGDELTIVRHRRMTPLVVEREGFEFPASVRPGDALIVFSKARVHAVAAELKRKGHRVSLIYGALPPDVRRNQAERFQQGETDVAVSTDAIAMGMNLPIERVEIGRAHV